MSDIVGRRIACILTDEYDLSHILNMMIDNITYRINTDHSPESNAVREIERDVLIKARDEAKSRIMTFGRSR